MVSSNYLYLVIIICLHTVIWLQVDHTKKSYMHNPAPVLEYNTHKLLWDFDIYTDLLISARRPDLIIINKKREFAQFATLLSQLTIE